MKRTIFFVLVSTALLISCTSGEIQEKADEVQLINQKIETLFTNSGLTGLSVAIIKDGSIQLVANYGVRDASTGDQVIQGTRFEAASLSKVVFSYLVLKLIDEGVLDLDKPLLSYDDVNYLEDGFFGNRIEDERFYELTLRNVMSHQSGLPNWRFFDGRDAPLAFRRDPGTAFGYSGEGFQLIQAVVEHVTGKDLETLAEEYVFTPLNMNSSSYILNNEMYAQTAVKTSLLGLAAPFEAGDFPQAMAAASLITTADDFARFLLALIDGEGVDPDTFESFHTPQVVISDNEDEVIHWGLGVGLLGNTVDAPLWHWGDNGNSRGFFILDRKNGNGVVYFSNDRLGLSVVKDIAALADLDISSLLDSDLMSGYPQWDTTMLRMVRLVRENDIEGALEIQRLLMEDEEKAEATESQVNLLGYLLLRDERFEDAIKMFTINAEFNPESANVWDSLGEAYWQSGDLENAKIYYGKALDKDPEFKSAIEALTEIEAEIATQ